MSKSNYLVLETKQDLDDLLKSHPYVVLDVYADWCMPCRYVAPKFEALSQKYPNTMFAKIRVEHLEGKYAVTALPTFLYFQNGELVNRVMGANIGDVEKYL
jgi:thioredoxin 1